MGRTGRAVGTRTPNTALDANAALPDAELARLAATGDRGAFEEIFHRHGAPMFRYVLHMLDGDAQDAEDAIQAAWIKAWLNLDGFRGDSSLRTWLFRLAGNEALTLRRRRRPVLVDDRLLAPRAAAPGDQPDRVATDTELRRDLALALSELPWRQRASWLLREVEGLSYDEIAHILHTSTAVVRGQLHRARAALAVRMEQWR